LRGRFVAASSSRLEESMTTFRLASADLRSLRRAPGRVVSDARRAVSAGALAVLGAGAVGISGCVVDETFVDRGVIAIAITEDTPPFFEDEEVRMYQVERRVELPVRAPTDAQLAALADTGGLTLPFDRLPWLRRGDVELELEYTISNVSDQTVAVALTINGFNEFHEYFPFVGIVQDDAVPDFAMYEWTVVLGPGERFTSRVREEQFDEVTVDLATLANGPPNFNQVVYFANQHDRDPNSSRFVPAVIPGLTGFRLGLRTIAQGAAPRVVLEATVRARDVKDKLVDPGETDVAPWTLPTPAALSPMPPTAM
jgi:hypothetical protein